MKELPLLRNLEFMFNGIRLDNATFNLHRNLNLGENGHTC